MKGNELKGALLTRFASEMELANGGGDNNNNNVSLATTPLVHSDDVPERQPTRRLESDAAVIKFVEELQLEKGVAGVEVDTHNIDCKFEEAEASTANFESSSSVLWSGVDNLKKI